MAVLFWAKLNRKSSLTI